VKGLRTAVEAFWAAAIKEIYIDGSFCTEKPDPGDIDGYWIEPDPRRLRTDRSVLDRLRTCTGAKSSEVEVAHVGRPRRRVLYPSGDAGNSGIGISGVLSSGPGRAAAG
jgi:hypothetical protein